MTSRCHCRSVGHTSGQDNVAVEVLSDIDVTLHDGVEGGLVNAGGLHAHHAGSEQHLWAAEALAANGDDLHTNGRRGSAFSKTCHKIWCFYGGIGLDIHKN